MFCEFWIDLWVVRFMDDYGLCDILLVCEWFDFYVDGASENGTYF